ncbi:MAG: sigma-70 family RNA polymerase sigma factor [Eubacterium sp.]|nr:sigma-70 family RNA polymerase sigma factor [Eubacterium sp.]
MKVSDENYVLRMKQGDEAALSYFIDKDGWIIKTMINRSFAILPDERQECMNDTFFAIWQNIGKYDGSKAAFTTWIAGVTRYCILNHLKKHKRMEYLSLEEIWDVVDEQPLRSNVYVSEEKEEFRNLLKGLSPYDQEIFMKLFWEEKDYGQIGKELQIEKPVLYNRISRGKKKLRQTFGKEVV